MPRRGWDDPWKRYPKSVPLPAEDGIRTSKQRGAMAESWWSRRFVEVLESYGLGARMQRGRRYARTGQVLSVEVRPAVIAAQVQGSRRKPYLVTLGFPEPTAAQWSSIEAAIAGRVGFLADLLDGEVPPELEDVFAAAGVDLFPRAWKAVGAECSCPDWENPCKHIAAVLYVFADQLDADPWLLLRWRGRDRDGLLEPLRGRGYEGGTTLEPDIAPWWPFSGAALPDFAPPPPGLEDPVADPDDPAAVLAQLDDLDVDVAGTPVADLLRTAYQHLLSGTDFVEGSGPGGH